MPGDIKFGFESFLKSCIHHFKMTDHTETVQAEYVKEDEEEGLIEEEEMRSLKVKMENMYLDNFVKKTPIDIFIPHNKNKKNLNKLRKKKNIDNNYEENKNKETI